jgi:hypothetical protein
MNDDARIQLTQRLFDASSDMRYLQGMADGYFRACEMVVRMAGHALVDGKPDLANDLKIIAKVFQNGSTAYDRRAWSVMTDIAASIDVSLDTAHSP